MGIKIPVAYSAHTCKRTTKIVSKEMLQTHVEYPYVRMKKLQEMDLHP